MSISDSVGARAPAVTPDRAFCRDSLDRSLLETAARAVAGRGGDDLDHLPVLGRRGSTPEEMRTGLLAADAASAAVPAERAGAVDAGAVAAWITARYPRRSYPAVVLGSPHGSAVHLAAALGAPWLPTAFTTTLTRPDGSAGDCPGALERGEAAARSMLAANPGVSIRQVHDPVRRGPLCSSTLTLSVRWHELPAAYREFLRDRLAPDGALLLLRDVRPWPVLDRGAGFSFQAGSPASGWTPAHYRGGRREMHELMRSVGAGRWTDPPPGARERYADTGGDPALESPLRDLAAGTGQRLRRVVYADPAAVSATVADLYRDWHATQGRGGDRCVVETGRMLDPWRVSAAGAVPYWMESASRPAATAAEQWLAGSRPFDTVTVLPQPPGTRCDAHAEPGQWRSMASFARRPTPVAPLAMARYPLLPLPARHAAHVLAVGLPPQSSPPPRLPVAVAMKALVESGPRLGLLVS